MISISGVVRHTLTGKGYHFMVMELFKLDNVCSLKTLIYRKMPIYMYMSSISKSNDAYYKKPDLLKGTLD